MTSIIIGKSGKKMKITKEYLKKHPDHIFVFGDNLKRKGKGGAARLRDFPNTYGFITKKRPNSQKKSYYNVAEYLKVFEREIKKLIYEIETNPDKLYLISQIGSGLANKFRIFEEIIQPNLHRLKTFENVKFLY